MENSCEILKNQLMTVVRVALLPIIATCTVFCGDAQHALAESDHSAQETKGSQQVQAPQDSREPKNSLNAPSLSDKSTKDCLIALSKVTSFDAAQTGYAGEASANFAAFARANALGSRLTKTDLEWLLKEGSPAGRLYAAILLSQTGKSTPAQSYGKLLADDSPVDVFSGCNMHSSNVNTIAKSFMDRNSFEDFKVGLSCNMLAPVKEKESPKQ